MTIVIILAILLVSLLVIVPLLERSNFRMSGDQMHKLSRWILPLVIVMVIIQLVRTIMT